jgi:hypothetical protein
MTNEEIEKRLFMLEKMMTVANPKDLPALNASYQKLMEKLADSDASVAFIKGK